MVRSELVTKLAHQYPNVLRKDIEKIIDIIFFEITAALSRGENIEIRGFGTYKIVSRKARRGGHWGKEVVAFLGKIFLMKVLRRKGVSVSVVEVLERTLERTYRVEL